MVKKRKQVLQSKRKSKEYIKTEKGWHCVKIIGGSTIFCTRADKASVQSVSLERGAKIKIVDPTSCTKRITSSNRVHWTCKF